MTTDTIGRYAPMPEPGDVRASGGIVHSDGNIFFTNIEKMESLFRAYADATCALREQDSWPDEASLPDGPLCCNKTKSVRCPGCPHAEPQDDRAAFEAWAQAEYGGPYTTLRRDDQPGSHHLGEYTRSYIETSWRAWQAALASRPVPPPISDDYTLWSNDEVMSLNAELGLTMDQIVRFARAIIAVRDAQWKGGV